jgi:hypothetical protein
MNSNTFLLNTLYRRWINIAFSFTLVLLSLSAIAEDAFYLAMNDGIITGKLPESATPFSITVANAEVATLSSGKQHIWVYGKQRLQAFHPDGSRLIDQHLPDLPADNVASDLGVGYERVWLAIGHRLYQFNDHGQLVKQRTFHNTIRSIHFDTMKSQILVTTAGYVFVLDSMGHELKRIRTHLPNIA